MVLLLWNPVLRNRILWGHTAILVLKLVYKQFCSCLHHLLLAVAISKRFLCVVARVFWWLMFNLLSTRTPRLSSGELRARLRASSQPLIAIITSQVQVLIFIFLKPPYSSCWLCLSSCWGLCLVALPSGVSVFPPVWCHPWACLRCIQFHHPD